MGTQASVSDSVITLPKGGGGLHGIGEKFSPDLFTGTGNFTIPISVPSGRNGFQPQLTLVYSTGSGNGFFGLGWGLSIPGIARKTAEGIPWYDDKKDVFILSGSEDLVPVGGVDSGREYRPRTEGLFARILHRKSGTTNHWEVQSKDGLISYYGSPEQTGNNSATVVKPTTETTPKIFAWKLTRTEDLFGNRIEYEYQSDQGSDGPHVWNQPRLSEIRYVDYEDNKGQRDFLVRVLFEYEQRLEDPFSEYRAGFEIRTTSRCKAVEIRTYPKLSAAPGLFRLRRYEFSYSNQSANGASLLTKVQVLGFDDSGVAVLELPPLSFAYTSFDPQKRKFQAVTGRGLPSSNLSDPNYALVDLFGCGLPSVLEMNGQVRYWRNLGGGIIDLPRPMQDAPPFSLADPAVQIVDANGDSRPDLLVTAGPLAGYYPMQFDGRWSRKSFQAYQKTPSFDLTDPEVHMVDLDGDGVVDVIRSSTRMECFFNDPKQGWQSDQDHVRWVPRRSLDKFPDVNFSDPRVKWADMSGDGLQDIILIHSGSVDYWPNLGRGDWGARVHMRKSPTLPWGYDSKRILLGDVDGDGAADFVYVEDRRVTLWINRHGNECSKPIVIEGTPAVSDMDSVRLTDFLGTGVAGILWSCNADSGRAHLFFLDFTGGIKPYLLSEMDNNLGATTRVTYKPSTAYYLEDRQPHASHWRTTLAFPVQVVARVDVEDAISQGRLTTEYRYHHGYWDGDEREFRGFGMVEQVDSESFETHSATSPSLPVQEQHFSPPVLTKTWFHLGPVEDASGEDWHEIDWSDEWWKGDPPLLGHKEAFDESLLNIFGGTSALTRQARRQALRALRGNALRTEIYALDGTEREDLPYTVSERAYAVTEIANPLLAAQPELKRVFFPHVEARRTTQWERGDDPLTQFSLVTDYDEFGQPRQQTAVAVPRRSAKRKPLQYFLGTLARDVINETRVLATHTRTEYAKPDAGLYLYDRVSQVRMFELVTPGAVQESKPNDAQQVLRDQWSTAQGVESAFVNGLKGWLPGQPIPVSLHLLSHTVNHYDGSAFLGREAGKVGPYGTLVRAESLVLTEIELKGAYETAFTQTRRPAYLGGAATDPNGAPAHFGENIGYVLRSDSTAGYHAGYYADSKRGQFDFHDANSTNRRGLLLAKKDAIGDVNDLLDRTTQISYDPYQLLPVKATDPVGLETIADYDYQFMQPRKVVDANGNASYFRYSPNGLLQKQWLLSQSGTEGGSEAKPESEFLYDFLRYEATRNSPAPQPIYVHMRQRTNHALDPLDAHPPDILIEAREFSDGFGRVIQKRAQAGDIIFGADGYDVGLALGFRNPTARDIGSALPPAQGHVSHDSVVVSGWQVYDNKGRVVEKYEPLFSSGWEFAAPLDSQLGAKVTMYYDPRGQLIRTVNPDQAEQRVLFGIPQSLDAPGSFAPTPWESYTYDASDLCSLAPSTSVSTVAADPSHLSTPANQVVDALGRVRCAVQRNGTAATDIYVTQSSYDVRGNILSVSDTMGRVAFSYAYDLLNRSLRINSIDAGIRTSVIDALGNFMEYRDSKGSVVLREYDVLNRLVHLWAVNDTTQAAFTLREQILYGDGGSRSQPQAERDSSRLVNRLGRLSQQYDEAGLLVFSRYDFKGNAVEKSRRVISDSAIAKGWTAHWNDANAEADLDPQTAAFQTNVRFDALSRSIEVVLPQEAKLRAGEANPHRAKITPHYNRAGALQAVELDGVPYVSRLEHNARGQRLMIAYGNGTMTRYAYDPATFRLARMRSERFQLPATNTWQGSGEPLQDYIYRYDPSGNVTSIEERVRGCGVENSLNGRDALVRSFTYDAIYRLLSATGRACANRASSFLDFPNCGSYKAPYLAGGAVPNQDNAPSLTELYKESYSYDPAGNMLELDYDVTRAGGPQRQWVRSFGMGGLAPDQWSNAATNRSTALTVDGAIHSYAFDDNGNMCQQDLDTFHTWDHVDRMIGYRVQAGPSPSVEARYLYGTDGIRVKKWVKNGGGQFESTVYVDETFEYHTWSERGTPAPKDNNCLHVMDGQNRVVLTRFGDRYIDDAGPSVQYHLGDHLGNSGIVLDDSGTWMNQEEYFPYGETSLGSFARKRYRFSGKERDEENGFNYHEARYYGPQFARWVSCDPICRSMRANAYSYGRQNPMCHIDRAGMADKPVVNPVNLGAAGTAEVTGTNNLIAKYSKVGPVTNLTPPAKGTTEGGVDTHLSVGEGKAAVNVVGDTKHSQAAERSGKSKVFTGKEPGGAISSFENAAKNDYGQLVRNVRAARAAGTLDPGTAHELIQSAKRGEVIHDVVLSGDNLALSETTRTRYQASVTAGDQFADAIEHRQSIEVRGSLNSSSVKAAGVNTLSVAGPMLFQMLWEHGREVTLDFAVGVQNKRSGTVTQSEIEQMNEIGYEVSGVDDKSHRLVWEKTWDRKVVDFVWNLTQVPKAVMISMQRTPDFT